MSFHNSSLKKNLSEKTAFFGVRLWVILLSSAALFAVFILIIIFLAVMCIFRQKSKSKSFKARFSLSNAITCNNHRNSYSSSSLDRRLLSRRITEIEMNIPYHHDSEESTRPSGTITDLNLAARISDAWKGNIFALRDIEVVTDEFSIENVIGNGVQGVVYRGILLDATRVAVKRLLSKCCQAEDFVAQVKMIGHVRHKNLVKLIGFCVEGDYRLLVNEYVDNGNLHQWLHGCPEQVSSLTWPIRMNIIQGVAKGLAYLHEDIEPKIFHQNLKSTNILLDHQWNPKVSDFGIVKLFGPERNQIAARLMGTSGYLSQEYMTNGLLDEKADVYSFGILIMEIICGRFPADHNQPQVYLIDWLKSMVANQKIMYVADPKLPEMPSSKELKRILLIALRCVDPDIKHRPIMGDVIHMLEPRDLLLNDEVRIRRDSSRRNCSIESVPRKSGEGDFNTHERGSRGNACQKMMYQ